MPNDDAPTGEIAIVFTDVQNSTHLWETETVAMRKSLTLHNKLMRDLLIVHHGYEVKTEGDAFMVVFKEVTDAMGWCMHVQIDLMDVDWPAEMYQHEDCDVSCDEQGNLIWKGLKVRMGMHVGCPFADRDPVTSRMDYFGPVVNLSARIGGLARGGELVLSQPAYNAINGKQIYGDPRMVSIGEQSLKGVKDRMPCYQALPEYLLFRCHRLGRGALLANPINPKTDDSDSDFEHNDEDNNNSALNADDSKSSVFAAMRKVACRTDHKWTRGHIPGGGSVLVFNAPIPDYRKRVSARTDHRTTHRPGGGNIKIYNEPIRKNPIIIPRTDTGTRNTRTPTPSRSPTTRPVTPTVSSSVGFSRHNSFTIGEGQMTSFLISLHESGAKIIEDLEVSSRLILMSAMDRVTASQQVLPPLLGNRQRRASFWNRNSNNNESIESNTDIEASATYDSARTGFLGRLIRRKSNYNAPN